MLCMINVRGCRGVQRCRWRAPRAGLDLPLSPCLPGNESEGSAFSDRTNETTDGNRTTSISTIGAQILRISCASSSFQHFVNFCSPFFKRMCKQGASISEIKSVFLKFFKRHDTTFVKFRLPYNEMVARLKF